MSELKHQFVELAHNLLTSYSKSPKHHFDSPAFEAVVTKLKSLTLSDFLLPSKHPSQISQGSLLSCNNLRISLFFLPKGSSLPIHDHPTMFVICKLLQGKLIYNQYKLLQPSQQIQIQTPTLYHSSDPAHKKHFSFPTFNAMKHTKILQEGMICYVTPEMNLHSIEAMEDSVFLDVICPDYNDKEIWMNQYEEVKRVGEEEVRLRMKEPKKGAGLSMVEVGFK